jgi:hypothetical protein
MDRPNGNANHAAQPAPRTNQPARITGWRESRSRIRGMSPSASVWAVSRTVATSSAPTRDRVPSSATVAALPTRAINGNVASGARVIASRTPVS